MRNGAIYLRPMLNYAPAHRSDACARPSLCRMTHCEIHWSKDVGSIPLHRGTRMGLAASTTFTENESSGTHSECSAIAQMPKTSPRKRSFALCEGHANCGPTERSGLGCFASRETYVSIDCGNTSSWSC